MEQPQAEILLNFFKALSQVERLQIIGLLIDQPRTVAGLAEALHIKETAVIRHLNQLKTAGLIVEHPATTGAAYQLDGKSLEHMSRVVFAQSNKAKSLTRVDLAKRVFRHYVDGEHLKALPDNYEEQMIILHWLAEHFQVGIRYPEREVNQVLERHYPDYALLRRYLVDNRMMQRAGGLYWRQENA